MTTHQNTAASNRHFTTMLKVAGELGCQLQPTPERPSVLRGFCPFHEAETLSAAKTLMINITTARFWCIQCPANGTPTAFTARTWHVTASDARALMDSNPSAGADRPNYPENYLNRKSNTPQPQRQNTAILTRAAHYYTLQLRQAYDPLHFLARLGVHPDAAAHMGLGFCPGTGLRDYLLDNGIEESEADQSTLFQTTTGLEIFSGRITITDQDYTGAAMWITSFPTDEPAQDYTWKHSPNPTMGIPGRKPYLFNLATLEQPVHNAVLTDDHRLYIALRSQQHPAILITQRRRDEMDVDRHVRRITEALATKDIRSISIAMHDRSIRDQIKNALAETAKAPKLILTKTRSQIIDYINLRSRDLDLLIKQDPEIQDPDHQPQEDQPLQDRQAPDGPHGPEAPQESPQPDTDPASPLQPEDPSEEETQ